MLRGPSPVEASRFGYVRPASSPHCVLIRRGPYREVVPGSRRWSEFELRVASETPVSASPTDLTEHLLRDCAAADGGLSKLVTNPPGIRDFHRPCVSLSATPLIAGSR